ncbi:MAG: GNAT family N-acetyltransferase [Bacteriovoracaceae bacterium]|nr:GNAT family N-acetyltransferase [Bacteriovoracaceae bacterium]
MFILERCLYLNENLQKIIQEMDTCLGSTAWLESTWQEWFKSFSLENFHYHLFFLKKSEADEKILGLILYLLPPYEEVAHLIKIVIEPKERGQKAGVFLLENSWKEIQLSQRKIIYLEVEETNKVAVSFYKSLGFKESHRIAHFYSHGTSAVVMMR